MIRYLYNLFNLHSGEETPEKTLETVKNNISFTGPNLWILVCAIIVASVGLNVNSTAVIIGAMLISPLMGPIVASGFALGVYDFELLKRALRNLLVATVASLLASTFYFFISPFKEVQSELLARTSPNIYDILIAFFGGIVGVIAVTRVEKGNPIPGVAIATALMPPLCTAGYGLATGNLRFFFGALFLYSINCVFICIATFAIVKYLKYPAQTYVNEKRQKQIRYGITALIALMLIPSAYFAYDLYLKQRFTQRANTFIENEFTDKGVTVVYKKTTYNHTAPLIELAFLSTQYTDEQIAELNDRLKSYGLSGTTLEIRENDNLELLKSDILNEVSKSENIVNEKDRIITELKNQIATQTFDNKQILKEAQAIFPVVSAVSLARHTLVFANDSTAHTTVLLYECTQPLDTEDIRKFENWLTQRLALPGVEIYRQHKTAAVEEKKQEKK